MDDHVISYHFNGLGKVSYVADGVVYAIGIMKVSAGERVVFADGRTLGVVMNLEAKRIGILVFGRDNSIQIGDFLFWTGKVLNVNVGAYKSGFIGDGLGQSLVVKKYINCSGVVVFDSIESYSEYDGTNWWFGEKFLEVLRNGNILHGDSYLYRRRIRHIVNTCNIIQSTNGLFAGNLVLPFIMQTQTNKRNLPLFCLLGNLLGQFGSKENCTSIKNRFLQYIRIQNFTRLQTMWKHHNYYYQQVNLNMVEKKAPGIIRRTSIAQALETGVKAIDSMVPIGKGQRELVLGDRQTGKTAICLDTIIHQSREFRRKSQGFGAVNGIFNAIYVAIGQKMSTVKRIAWLLKMKNCWRNVTLICSTASSAMGYQYLAPYVGTSIGEYWRELGMDALIIYDDLSKHANIYRQISLLLGRPPGREAYPGDVFYLHSRLLERSAKLVESWAVWRCGLTALWKWEHGVERLGGTLTALPIAETIEGDVSAYIPTNLISITDGQIVLDTNLFKKGVRPAVNLGLSVSRVGSMAQSKMMKYLAKDLKLELAQFREVEDFAKFGSSLDEATLNLINRGQRLIQMMVQKNKMPMQQDHQLLSLFAASEGFLDNIAVNKVATFENIMHKVSIETGIFGRIWFKDNIRKPSVKLNVKKLNAFLEEFADWFCFNLKN